MDSATAHLGGGSELLPYSVGQRAQQEMASSQSMNPNKGTSKEHTLTMSH